MGRFLELLKNERAATAVEYSLILGMVFLALVLSVKAVAATTIEMWNYVAHKVIG